MPTQTKEPRTATITVTTYRLSELPLDIQREIVNEVWQAELNNLAKEVRAGETIHPEDVRLDRDIMCEHADLTVSGKPWYYTASGELLGTLES